MKYCQRCVLPDTRPNLVLNEHGICNACLNHEKKPDIDWEKREIAFREVVNNARKRSSGYDCLIPVSGGKDSTWQVVKCLEYGLNPLAVTWAAPSRTAVGIKNLQNLIGLGVDHIDYRISPLVEKKFLYQALLRYGATAIPMHMALFNIPLKIALKFDIPLIVWGENSAFEYGGTAEESRGFKLDSNWLKKFGVTHGTTAADWVSEHLSAKELTAYCGPTDREIEEQGLLAVFLGYYFGWDPEKTYKTALAHGFSVENSGPRTGLYDYADIDDDFISIHHYLKWYKFGFTRLFDNLSIEIRNGRLTREKALEIIRQKGEQTPYEDIAKFCRFVDISEEHFFSVAENFRNRAIWTWENGCWVIKDFIIPYWRWN